MAVKSYRINQKTAEGYDILHVQTNSKLVLRPNDSADYAGAKTVEESLTSLETAVADKLDKLAGGVTGNLVSFGAEGAIADSGKKADDFAAAEHTHTGDDVTVGSEAGKVVVTGESGALTALETVTSAELAYLTGVSSNIQTQLDGKAAAEHDHDGTYIKVTDKGTAEGVAPLDASGKIAASYLPSYVDDVIEGTMSSDSDVLTFTPTEGADGFTPESGKIYVDTATGKTYRYGGSTYAEISASLVLGTTDGTAFDGAKGQTAYEHSQSAHAPADATKTEKSNTNGNIKIAGEEVTVYTHPSVTPTASTESKSLSSGGTVDVLTAITAADGHVSAYTTTTLTMPQVVDMKFQKEQPDAQSTGDIWFEALDEE